MSPGKHKKKENEPVRSTLFLLGESPMVEEYGELCAGKGYDVLLGSGKSPKGSREPFRRSSAIPRHAHLALELTNVDLEAKRSNLRALDEALPPTAAILSTSVTVTASEQSTWIKHKHRLAGIGVLPTLAGRPLVEVAPTVHSPAETLQVVQRFLASLGKECEFVQDRVGMVLPRILCQIINEACFALQDEVAAPQDIDTAMKLGVNYPYGPIEWADRIGFRQVHAVLDALERDLREDRYRIAPLLRQMTQTGEWWKQSQTTLSEQ